MIKQTLLQAIAFTLVTSAFSQSVTYVAQNTTPGVGFLNDFNGRPLYVKSDYVASGSPYLYDEYCMAEITAMNGKVYSNVKVKINLQEKLLLYMADNGAEMIMATPVKKIKFYNYVADGVAHPERTFQSHLAALNAEGAAIYEVLAQDSTATLLKQTVVSYIDTKGYGEAITTRVFKKNVSYFAAIPSQSIELQKVEKNKSALTALFGSKASVVTAYIDEKKLKCKSDEDLVEVFRYYYSLK